MSENDITQYDIVAKMSDCFHGDLVALMQKGYSLTLAFVEKNDLSHIHELFDQGNPDQACEAFLNDITVNIEKIMEAHGAIFTEDATLSLKINCIEGIHLLADYDLPEEVIEIVDENEDGPISTFAKIISHLTGENYGEIMVSMELVEDNLIEQSRSLMVNSSLADSGANDNTIIENIKTFDKYFGVKSLGYRLSIDVEIPAGLSVRHYHDMVEDELNDLDRPNKDIAADHVSLSLLSTPSIDDLEELSITFISRFYNDPTASSTIEREASLIIEEFLDHIKN